MPYELHEGEGSLFSNDRKVKPSQPDYTGKLVAAGKTWRLAGWKRTSRAGGGFLSLRVSEEQLQQQIPTQQADLPIYRQPTQQGDLPVYHEGKQVDDGFVKPITQQSGLPELAEAQGERATAKAKPTPATTEDPNTPDPDFNDEVPF